MMLDTLPNVEARPYLLKNSIQHYDWGTRGNPAFIPNLLGFEQEPGVPYAELWIGAHPKAPSNIVVGEMVVPLDQWINAYPVQILGSKIANKFSNKLPFLFKVLSASESLSIQVHPNQAQANALHLRDPIHYPDANHKPELAVALDSLTALMGIKPFADIQETLRRYPEIADFIGKSVCTRVLNLATPDPQKQQILTQTLFSTLVKNSISYEKELVRAIEQLAGRLSKSSSLEEIEILFLSLRAKYSGPDVGLFVMFLLNLVHLKQGQGLFTDAGTPHAYLKGNIVECMANSDNVVRVGLTHKFTDPENLIDIINYTPASLSVLGNNSDLEEKIYQTPASEFRVSRLKLSSSTERQETTENGLKLFLVTKGIAVVRWNSSSEDDRIIVKQGQSILIPACLREFQLSTEAPVELFKVEVPVLD
ncbi:MAG: mannose-6-phosphate isomerase, class I [Anaerolineae bacterium]|nr:mannose-6-phosphate isomerase, class I [Anaerolineae bacterium]